MMGRKDTDRGNDDRILKRKSHIADNDVLEVVSKYLPGDRIVSRELEREYLGDFCEGHNPTKLQLPPSELAELSVDLSVV